MDEQINGGQSPRSNKTLLIIVIIIALIAIAWFAMGGFGKTNSENLNTALNENGFVNIGNNKLPDNWPSDAPTYPKASIQYSGTNNPQTGAEGSAVVFLTEDSMTTVLDFYKNELTSKGWKIQQTATIGGATVLAALKDTRTLGVYISDIGNGQVSVTVGIEIK